MNNLIKSAEKLLKDGLNVKKSERVCIVKDYDSKIVKALEEACSNNGFEYNTIKIPLNRKNSSPIPSAREHFKKCDVIIAPTRNSITHSHETSVARKKGAGIITLPGITEKIFMKILGADFDDIDRVNKKIYNQVNKKLDFHIKTKNGTDLRLKVGRRKWIMDGMKTKRWQISNAPSGEVFTAPIENSASGIIVIDRWERIKSKDKAKLFVKNGKIESWSKGAEPYIKVLGNDKNSRTIAELGIGTNKAHKKPIGNILHDEKIFKSCHIAFGMNESFGGKNRAGVHEDIILMNPIITADGKKIRIN
jgi:leucyl aminopeptidase (aminopeptidase T)